MKSIENTNTFPLLFAGVESATRLLEPHLNKDTTSSSAADTSQNGGSCGQPLPQTPADGGGEYATLDPDRITSMVDMMRDVTVYVESKDFELGLPITNFARYHELYQMQHDCYGYDDEDADYEE